MKNLTRQATSFRKTSLAACIVLGLSIPMAANATVVDTVLNKVNAVSSMVGAVKLRVMNMYSAFAKQQSMIEDSKDMIESTIRDTVGQIKEIQHEMQEFKGDNCDDRSQCGELRARIIGIYYGMRGVSDILPGFDVLPNMASSNGIEPMVAVLEKIPPIMLFSMHKAVGNLDTLDNLEDLASWMDQLRFYSINPIEEDEFYRFDLGDCAELETSIIKDNEIWAMLKNTAEKTEIITHFGVELMPITWNINAWVGTDIPNPVKPVFVFMNKVSLNLDRFLDEELEVRGKLVKQCRKQIYNAELMHKVDMLLRK